MYLWIVWHTLLLQLVAMVALDDLSHKVKLTHDAIFLFFCVMVFNNWTSF